MSTMFNTTPLHSQRSAVFGMKNGALRLLAIKSFHSTSLASSSGAMNDAAG